MLQTSRSTRKDLSQRKKMGAGNTKRPDVEGTTASCWGTQRPPFFCNICGGFEKAVKVAEGYATFFLPKERLGHLNGPSD